MNCLSTLKKGEKRYMPVPKEPIFMDNQVTRHKVRDGIQQKILSGEYPPGARLGQIQLAREFEVSQSVVRESLLELKAFGMVELKSHLGAFVSGVDSRKLVQGYEIREVLEGLAARLCCDRISREELRELEQTAGRMRDLLPSQNDQRLLLDREFHHRIVLLSRNDMLIQFSESYQILGKVVKIREDEEDLPEDHLNLLRPIRENRPEEAEQLMREHIHKGRLELEKKIADGTFKLQWVV
jgi:DNA-binding GntR family transcriptional regulator